MTPNSPLTPPTLTEGQRKAAVIALKVAAAVAAPLLTYAAAAVSGHPIPLDLASIAQAVAGALGF